MPKGIYKRNSNMKTGKYNHKKGIESSAFKDGRSSEKHYCKELNCNNEITYQTWICGNGMCRECYRKFISIPQNNPNFKGGRGNEPYPLEYTPYLKAKIRKRDNYTCQGEDCGITEKQHLILYDRVLDIHHIDYDKQNINLGNLISLCHKCNIKANFNREYWKNYYSSIISDLISV